MEPSSIIKAYEAFMSYAQRLLNIDTQEKYEVVLETLEQVLESASDCIDEPLNPLIEILSQAIERYEAQDKELALFTKEAEALPGITER